MTAPGPGDRVGPIAGTNQFGQQLQLGAGGWSLLFFYPFAFTGICGGELDQLQTDREAYAESGCRVAAISCDSMYALRVFAEDRGLEFDLISDHWPHGALAQRFGVFDDVRGCALRGSFLIDPEGMLRWSVVNPIGVGRDLPAQLAAVRSLTRRSSPHPR